MVKIFVDFEMHPIDRSFEENRRICQNEIIEIGAVKLDDNNEEIDSFKLFVKPMYNKKVNKNVEHLTGICTNDLIYCDDFMTCLEKFAFWCGEDFVI